MPKRIALKDSVIVNAIPVGDWARSVEFQSEHERVDVSTFNVLGTNEYLAGATEQSVTVEFYNSYGTDEVHQTLYPIHQDRDVVAFKWRPDGSTAVSATNPELRGNVQLLTYSPSATRGEAETWTATFTAADGDGLAYVTTP